MFVNFYFILKIVFAIIWLRICIVLEPETFFQVQTHNGSVRTQETTLEQIQTEASNRAIENQYSFV